MTSRTSPVLAQFLRSRRARLDPATFGFSLDNRRTPGLRREEVAQLAGISRDYYVRLEQGQGHQMSDQVLNCLAVALHLDETERTYLYRIARPVPSSRASHREPMPVSEQVLTLLSSWANVPAYVIDSNQDIVAINEMADYLSPGYAWYGDNIAISAFAVLKLYPGIADFVDIARSTVAALRFNADPDNPRLREIVGQLSVDSPLFRQMWTDHDARPMTEGTVPISVDGSEFVTFPWQILEVPGGFSMTVWPVPDGTRAHELLIQIRETKLTGRPVRGPLQGWPIR
jgi:transcriptional regulator with XRE-family HTH domain